MHFIIPKRQSTYLTSKRNAFCGRCSNTCYHNTHSKLQTKYTYGVKHYTGYFMHTVWVKQHSLRHDNHTYTLHHDSMMPLHGHVNISSQQHAAQSSHLQPSVSGNTWQDKRSAGRRTNGGTSGRDHCAPSVDTSLLVSTLPKT